MPVECSQKAAEQGHPESQYDLGIRFIIGRGCLKDEKRGIEWCKRAALQGYQPAIDALKQRHVAPLNSRRCRTGNEAPDRPTSSFHWHCTDWRGFREILRSGEIRPNTGDRRCRHGMSHLGRSFRMGGVSLFDGQVDPKLSMFDVWITAHHPITIAFKLNGDDLEQNLIRTGPGDRSFPGITVRGEVCHKGATTWDAVLGCLFVRAAKPEQREFVTVEHLTSANIARVIYSLRLRAKGD